MKSVRRVAGYTKQNGDAAVMIGWRPLTPAQKRRIRHKNHKMLGAAGGGTVKAKQVKTRQARPAPTPGGLLRLLSPSQMRKQVAARSARTGIKFKIKGRTPDMIIIDDEMQRGNGDR